MIPNPPDQKRLPPGTTPAVNPAGTALVLLDFQHDVLDRNVPAARQVGLVGRVADVLAAARARGIAVVHVVVRFRAGYPEVSPRDVWRRDLPRTGRLQEGSAGAEIVAGLAPLPGEVVVVKRRTGAFSTTDLAAVLRARDIDTVVLAGVATGGSVLSTLREAADLDYRIVVLADGCADPDDEVHRILCTRVFPRQALVLNTSEFAATLPT